jgi:hypothetical protein
MQMKIKYVILKNPEIPIRSLYTNTYSRIDELAQRLFICNSVVCERKRKTLNERETNGNSTQHTKS